MSRSSKLSDDENRKLQILRLFVKHWIRNLRGCAPLDTFPITNDTRFFRDVVADILERHFLGFDKGGSPGPSAFDLWWAKFDLDRKMKLIEAEIYAGKEYKEVSPKVARKLKMKENTLRKQIPEKRLPFFLIRNVMSGTSDEILEAAKKLPAPLAALFLGSPPPTSLDEDT
jgi:hypothetical protein